jgi:dipeptidyl-peptidase-4
MASFAAIPRAARVGLAVSTLALTLVDVPVMQAQNGPAVQNGSGDTRTAPNYELAARWMPQRVGRLVFDTNVTPRWLEKSDRFWYTYQTRDGRKFFLVDPVKKTKGPLFDHAKMAASLTMITRIPYDAQHLPFSTGRFIKDDTVFAFEVQVPRDAVLGETPRKITTTTDAQASGDGRDEPQQGQRGQVQQGQRGQGRGAAAAGGRGNQPRNRTLHFEYDLASARVTLVETPPAARMPRWGAESPDGKTIVFARNHNLYMMDAENWAKAQKDQNDKTIVEHQLTTDGEEHYSYARTVNAGQQQQEQQDDQEGGGEQGGEREDDPNQRVPAINVIWSQDSSKFSLVRRDSRKVKDMWVINALAEPRPTLETYRYAMPGEENIHQSEIHVFDVAAKKGVRLKVERFKDQSVSVPTKPRAPGAAAGGGRGGGGGGQGAAARPTPAEWLSASPSKMFVTRLSRDMHRYDIAVADTTTGEVTTLIEERLNTYIENKPLRLLNNETELLFWSERDGWGHFYLYDAATGKLKNRITDGEFVTTSLDAVDEKARQVYITAAGREKGEDPYYTHLYRVGLDGSGMTVLNGGDANHSTSVSPSQRYFVDNSSRVDGAPSATLRDMAGAEIMKLESPDLGPLTEAGFKFPEPFSVKAADGITDLYGVMYKPFDFDPNRKYPIIAFVYPGPQTESVTKTFNPRSSNVSLAQFGFVVIEVGNRGGHPTRSKWYHNFGYGNLRDYGLADKKAAIEQLAQRHPFIDIGRVGIWGHSGGGFMSAAAMLVYPDFFKAAFSEAGNHENNIYNNTWSEKHHGIKEIEEDGEIRFEYAIDRNSDIAKNLKGHLMLIHGDIDNNVHPANTMRMVDALIKANKRFEMMILPGVRHSFAPVSEYVNWLRGDFFSRHLLGTSDTNIDITHINRDREQSGERRRN